MVALVAAAACGGGDDASQPDEPFTTTTEQGAPSTTTTTAPSTTTTAVTVDPAVLPTEVTVEYAQAVMDELVHLEGEILRLAVAGEDPARAAALGQAIYEEAYGAFRAGILVEDLAAGFVNVRPRPGDRVVEVTDVLAEAEDCVGLQLVSDFSPVSLAPAEPLISIVELLLRPVPPAGPDDNPTPFVIDDERPLPDGVEAFVPC